MFRYFWEMNEITFPQGDHCVCVYMNDYVTWRHNISQQQHMIKPKIYQMSCISMYHDAIFDMEVCLCLCESHLHFVTVEEVNVWFVLFVVLTDEQKDRRVSCLVQQRLTVMNCGQRKVFKLFLRETKRNKDQEN